MMNSQKNIRIARFLAECGTGSRRVCEDMVREGRVSVNGSVVKDLSVRVTADDKVKIDDKKIFPQKKLVLALNKPPGYLSTVRDDRFRKTVMHLTGGSGIRLYPAGRLDKDSRGLIILTNNGDLVYRITHPKFNVPKTYEVVLDRPLKDKDLEKLKKGVMIENRLFRPHLLTKTGKGMEAFPIRIRIHEGRKRIIRRAFKKAGYNVTDLKRIKIGGFSLGDIPEGKYRVLDSDEIDRLTMARSSKGRE